MPRLLTLFTLFASLALTGTVRAQGSTAALRFFGTGVGPPGQQDRVLFAVDDNEPGAVGSTSIDLGAGGFTLELWLRGELGDNATANDGGDVETFDDRWISGNIVLDRDIWCGSERKFGVSVAGGFVRFGTSAGDEPSQDFSANTIEGNTPVLDGTWHHVAVVRDVADGRKHIYVDGVLDFSSSEDMSFADLSYPDEGIPVTPGKCGPGQLTPYGWFLVLAAEKHDAGSEFPSFNGFADELRLWSVARSPEQIAASWNRRVDPGSPGLVGDYRFEEGSGTAVNDSGTAGAPVGDLRSGAPGNGEWVLAADDPANTAPILAAADLIFGDGFESGDTSAWSQP